ncbi:ATP-dependent DNA ligase [Streptomyces sp. NPDC048442]|uniref:ATP-dependent DNA ligase n=1 Tax=Streptomyces sp. NPDC048442 TaxID=3154823 RepID=UPI00342695D6
MLLDALARVSRDVAATSARSKKTALLAELFRAAAPEDVPIVVPYLSGRLPQGRIGIGWNLLRETVPPAAQPTLTVAGVDAALTAFATVAGRGAQTERAGLVRELMAAATEEEQRFLRGLLTGEVRQGALDALAAEGLAVAAGAAPADVRRAVMLGGSLTAVGRALLAEGPGALTRFTLRVGRAVPPMLASPGKSLDEALAKLGPCAVEEKLDGIRVQVHRDGDEVRVFTRTLEDITDRIPELIDLARELEGDRFVLDGEVIALGADGRPLPFQDVAGRVGSRLDVAAAREALPLSPVFFDVLAADGESTLDLPYRERRLRLERLVPGPQCVRRAEEGTDDTETAVAARAFLARTLERGHEGVVLKALDAPYQTGRRGASWLKVKPVHTLDLVVLAAEWGHGRRTGKLSNLHLGALRPDGSFAMLGKTFKGLTDAMLEWQTERLGALKVSEEGYVVHVRPELVVEIAFDGIQRSTRYPEGVTLRFARVVRYREDKRASDANTVADVLASGPLRADD